MECAKAKDYDFEDVCETGATGCEETCIWSMEQLWNILSGVRRGLWLCCNELHVVIGLVRTLTDSVAGNEFSPAEPQSLHHHHSSNMAHNTFFGTLPLSGIHLSFFIVSIFVSVLV